MNNRIKINTYLADGGVYQELDIMGHITREFINMAAIQKDEKIKEALINLGWTPPKDDNSSVG